MVSMKPKLLVLKQLDRQLASWIEAKKFFQPRKGWVLCIRNALGITLPQLAKRLKVVRSRVIKIQQAELSGSLTLHTLRETANALNCDLVYAFIPRKPLQVLIRERAEKIAKQRLQHIAHSMALENQEVTSSQRQNNWKN